MTPTTDPQKRVPRGKRAAAWLAAAGAVGGLVTASPGLVSFLHKWEDGGAPIRVAYADRLANGLPTTCYGMTSSVTSRPVYVGDAWSEQECAEEFGAVLDKTQDRLIECFEQKPPQSVFDAATSHAHNFGVGATCASTAMQAWGRGEWLRGCELLAYTPDGKPNWSSVKTGVKLADGRPEMRFVPGLHNRRRDESKLCKSGL